MPWHRLGTISVTLNSSTVTGVGTGFAANTRIGDAFIGPDGRQYELANVASDTVISITPAYLGPTASGATYAIVPVQGYQKGLSDQVRDWVNTYGSKMAALGTTGNYDILPVNKGGTGGTTALGTAAFLTATTSNTDSTVGRALKVGDLGVGVPIVLTSPNLNTLVSNGTYYCDTPTNSPGNASGWLVVTGVSANYASQTFNALSTGIKYWRELVAGVWGKWDAVYSSRNSVGTVSQAGGAPTGALMEYVSTASGEAWKFACGLMICTRTIYSGSTPITSALGPLFYYPLLPRFSFAATFAALPDTKITIRSYGPVIWAANGNSDATTTQGPVVYPICVGSVTVDIEIHQLAIGRWF
jgi:hypothetical protein